MGHIPIGMEDYVAEGVRPLRRCLADVTACDAYIGILGWRYRFVPPLFGDMPLTAIPDGTALGVTSITEFEYRQALADGKGPLMFLLDPQTAWPAHQFDAVTGENQRGQSIAALRDEVSQSQTIGFFRTPDELASMVSAAIYRREMDRQMDLDTLQITADLNAPFSIRADFRGWQVQACGRSAGFDGSVGAAIYQGAGGPVKDNDPLSGYTLRVYMLVCFSADFASGLNMPITRASAVPEPPSGIVFLFWLVGFIICSRVIRQINYLKP